MLKPKSIPKIIHQTAPADETKWHSVWKPCQETWKKHFPDYEYKMWTDEDLDSFIKTKYNWFYPTFVNYPRNINRIDAARYFILYEYGGIYADMDYECIKNFEHLLPKGKACAGESPWHESREKYQNSLMASPRKHPFWKHVFKDLENHKNVQNPLYSAGPECIRRAAELYPELFFALPKKNFAQEYGGNFEPLEFNKYNPMDNLKISAPVDMYARYHGTTVWAKV
jgi:mannosyltransferase OCH1-like enzyme